jgi:hypothetical protein
LATKLALVRFRAFAQGREIGRKEADKTLQEWGFKDLEGIMIQVQERIKEDPHPRKLSGCETWVSSRFDDIHSLLSLEERLSYPASQFLCTRPPEPTFVNELRRDDMSWEELFSRTHPWELYYSLYVLNDCLKQYKQGIPEFQWVLAFGERQYFKFVEHVEWLSIKMMEKQDFPFSMLLTVTILDGFMHMGMIFQNFLTVDPEPSWIRRMPVGRMIKAMLNFMRFQARQNFHLALPVMHVLSGLAALDAKLWLKVADYEFKKLFIAMGLESSIDSTRENIWNALLDFFQVACHKAFAVTNGNSEQSDSDVESKMDIDQPTNDMRRVVLSLWQLTLDCLKKAEVFISFASKSFETAANMLRSSPRDVTEYRIYHKHIAALYPDDASELLRAVAKLAQRELFNHRVQETVLNSAVDYITLGWTRMLQAVLDLMPEDESKALMPTYHDI